MVRLTRRGKIVAAVAGSALFGVSVLSFGAWQDHRMIAGLPKCEDIKAHAYDADYVERLHAQWFAFPKRDGSFTVYCR